MSYDIPPIYSSRIVFKVSSYAILITVAVLHQVSINKMPKAETEAKASRVTRPKKPKADKVEEGDEGSEGEEEEKKKQKKRVKKDPNAPKR
jgi:hypothetical protein